MATGRVSKRSVDAFAPNGTKQFLWDDDLRGFGVQITPGGVKSYIFQYRTGGRESSKRRYTIGRHGSPWTPTTARGECERLALLVGQGIDPADKDNERRRQAVDLAFASYIETFRDGYLKLNWKDWAGAERLLLREPLEVLKNKPLPLVRRADIVAVLDKLIDRPAVARQAYAVMRKLFGWAEGRGEIERSPMGAEFPTPRAVPARDRVLNDAELSLAWHAAASIPYPFGPLYRLLIATGARREEGAGLIWTELDRTNREWTLPPARAKNGLAHIIPLNEQAVAVFDCIAGIDDQLEDDCKWPDSGLVFTTTGKTPVSGHSKAKRILDGTITSLAAKRALKSGFEPQPVSSWRVHDIRRTVATGLQRLGIRFEVTEAVLNHISGSKGGVAGVYQRHNWKEEKRIALDAWGRHLDNLLLEDKANNVVN